MMFAVVKTGGKQYRVAPGDVVLVERLAGEEGQSVKLTDVLMVSEGQATTIGFPLVVGASVEATIKAQTRGDKIIVFKKKRRQGYRRKKGHRQDLTLLSINSIQASSTASAVTEKPAKKVEEAEKAETKPKAVRVKKTQKVEKE